MTLIHTALSLLTQQTYRTRQFEPSQSQTMSSLSYEGIEHVAQNLTPTKKAAKRSAFEELMKPVLKKSKVMDDTSKASGTTTRPTALSGLLAYITKPESFPPGTIIRRTKHTVLIKDLYPKALVHLLLLPIDPKFYNLTPFEAFNTTDDEHQQFLELMKAEAASAAKLASSELSRLISPCSSQERARRAALDDESTEKLTEARDFQAEIKVGIHAEPSMSTLHIHIISQDNYSPSLKTRKHYNSFNTNFFISLEDFPLMEEDNLTDKTEQQTLLKGDLRCWRCNKNFGNKFKQLKDHLEDEYQEWKRL